MTRKITDTVIGDATGRDRAGTLNMLRTCNDLGISAYFGVGLKGQELYLTHRDMIPRILLGDALVTLGKRQKPLLIRPYYESGDERAFDCSMTLATALAAKGISFVLLSTDRDLLSLIKSKGSSIETCLYIPDLSQSRDPLATLQRLGCKYMATDFADPAEGDAYEGIAETLFGRAEIRTWLFTGDLDPTNCRIPRADWINLVSNDPVRFIGSRASRGKP